MNQCCCKWGAAVGNRGNGPSGEWPEGPCKGCPVHLDTYPQEMDTCRRHCNQGSESIDWLEGLNRLYKETASGAWRFQGGQIVTPDEMLDGSPAPDFVVAREIDSWDAEFVVAIRAAFPELLKRVRSAEENVAVLRSLSKPGDAWVSQEEIQRLMAADKEREQLRCDVQEARDLYMNAEALWTQRHFKAEEENQRLADLAAFISGQRDEAERMHEEDCQENDVLRSRVRELEKGVKMIQRVVDRFHNGGADFSDILDAVSEVVVSNGE